MWSYFSEFRCFWRNVNWTIVSQCKPRSNSVNVSWICNWSFVDIFSYFLLMFFLASRDRGKCDSRSRRRKKMYLRPNQRLWLIALSDNGISHVCVCVCVCVWLCATVCEWDRVKERSKIFVSMYLMWVSKTVEERLQLTLSPVFFWVCVKIKVCVRDWVKVCVLEVVLGRKCVSGRLMGESTHFFIARNSQGESLRPITWRTRQKVSQCDILKKYFIHRCNT